MRKLHLPNAPNGLVGQSDVISFCPNPMTPDVMQMLYRPLRQESVFIEY
jgi:hypothetical protein